MSEEEEVPLMKSERAGSQKSSCDSALQVHLYYSPSLNSETTFTIPTGHITAESVCVLAAKASGFLPVFHNLFALASEDLSYWYPPTHVFNSEENVKVHYRVRFFFSSWFGQGSKASYRFSLSRGRICAVLDYCVIDYLFAQSRSDFVLGRGGISPPLSLQQECLGMAVLDLWRMAKERNQSLGEICNTTSYKTCLPETHRQDIQRMSRLARYQIRKTLKRFLKKLGRCSAGERSLKLKYLMELNVVEPNYGSESFTLHHSGWLEQSEQQRVKAVRVSGEGGIQIQTKDSQEWQTFCDFPQITDISIKRLSQEQMPLEGRVVTLTRQDDQCMEAEFHTLTEALSFVCLVDGYFRLTTDSTHYFCTEVAPPSLLEDIQNYCHGPITSEFAVHKLKKAGAKNGMVLSVSISEDCPGVKLLDPVKQQFYEHFSNLPALEWAEMAELIAQCMQYQPELRLSCRSIICQLNSLITSDNEIIHATGTLPKSDSLWRGPNMFKKQQQDIFEERYLRFISVLGKVPSSSQLTLRDRMSGPEMVPADLEQLWGVIQQQTVEIMSLKQEIVGLRAEVTALRAETAGLRAECGALQSDLTTLQADYDDLAAAQIAPAEPIRPAQQPKISLPDKWDGSGARCDVFLTNLSLIFEFQPSRYPTDRSRIALLVSLLTGQAAEWATAVLKANSDSAHSYPAFTTQLRAAFQHPESEVEVDSRLYHLKQGERSVSRYTTEFRTLSVQTTWSDAALRTAYYEGLSIRLKDELAVRELPDTLEGMIQLALRVDQRMRHHSHRTNPVSRSSTGTIPRIRTLDSPVTYAVAAPSPPPPIASEAHSTGAGEPMQIGRTSLSAAERARRYREGLCAYCASPEHHRAICPLRPGNGQTR
ncbi:tyrosine-protein kinase JAK3 [Labeo rohita]|uniref:tyrosine-protein kinase JAK3 n=1 Tax=Labeo rohita TaxID=84645 RepID=UPI0021E23950|nr:tyrosine-protein kinase JAK3 [Labeo rohita]